MSKGLDNLLADIAKRCNIQNENILRKGKELLALLNSNQQLVCSDTSKAVVCLELASSLSSYPLSRENAIKYSGCKRKIYMNLYNNISKLLNLDKVYSVKEICLLIGANHVQENATKLLQKYKATCSIREMDLEHPMYPCAAILATCRTAKTKINTAKLIDISRIKKLELNKLADEFQSLIEVKENHQMSKKNVVDLSKCMNSVAQVNEPIQKRKRSEGLMSDKEYKEWKKKMLED